MTSLINTILEQPVFKKTPPVLVDIGASYHIHPIWETISKYSICLAFDPDTRQTGYLEENDKGFRTLYTFPYLVSAENNKNQPFFLTNSPYCSSSLEPDIDSVSKYEFHQMFGIDREVALEAKTLISSLADLNIDQIDWLKSDTQGTDLRIFSSLPEKIRNTVLTCDFEPGIIDAYKGEDKLHHVLQYMDDLPFWVADLDVKGVKRVSKDLGDGFVKDKLKKSPCWAEITYFNDFSSENLRNERTLFLGWIFSTILGQHGFALELGSIGKLLYENPLFEECIVHSKQMMIPKKLSFHHRALDAIIRKLNSRK